MREIGLAGERDALFGLHRAACIEVNEERVFIFAVRIGAEGRHHARHVRRAACAGIPLRAGGQHCAVRDGLAGNARYDLKRVHIEETLAVKLHAGEHGVVERALHHIGIFAAVLVFKHLLREEHQTDGGAGLGVHGVVRQVIIDRKGFTHKRGADAARNVHAALCDALPQIAAGSKQCLVLCFLCDVRHAGVKVHGTHGVAHGVLLLTHGQGALGVVGIQLLRAVPNVPAAVLFFFHEIVRGLTAHVYKVLCKLLILFVARGAPQAHQCELHLRVARVGARVFLHELLVNAVCTLRHDVEQLALAGDLIIRHGSLHHVSCTVKLMCIADVRPHFVGTLHGEIGIDIAIFVLGSAVELNGLVHGLFKLRVFARCKRIGCRFDPLCDIAVLEHHTVEFVRLYILAPQLFGCKADIFNGVALFDTRDGVVQDIILIRQHLLAHELLHFADETVIGGKGFYGDTFAFHLYKPPS